jgi:hypothetical protein
MSTSNLFDSLLLLFKSGDSSFLPADDAHIVEPFVVTMCLF